jgi:hypothetical protein
MRELAQYYELMLTTVVGYVENLLNSTDVPTAEQVTCMIEVLDTVVILDALKTWQMGLNNDFSMVCNFFVGETLTFSKVQKSNSTCQERL